MRRLQFGRAVLEDAPMLGSVIARELKEHGTLLVERMPDRYEGGFIAGVFGFIADDELEPGTAELRNPAGDTVGRIYNLETERSTTPMSESTHRLTLQLTVNDDELERQRDAYITENPEDEELANFYGRPAEWQSVIDVIDAHDAGVILRTEVTGREHRVTPYDPYRKPSRWRRTLKVFGLTAVVAGMLAGVGVAASAVWPLLPDDAEPYFAHKWEAENVTRFDDCRGRGEVRTSELTGSLPLYSRFVCDAAWGAGRWKVRLYSSSGDVHVAAYRIVAGRVYMPDGGGSTVTALRFGTAGPDYLVGTRYADLIEGLGGNDDLEGLRAADTLLGGPGDDYVGGGRGADVVRGGSGYDVCFGGRGADVFVGCEFLPDLQRVDKVRR